MQTAIKINHFGFWSCCELSSLSSCVLAPIWNFKTKSLISDKSSNVVVCNCRGPCSIQHITFKQRLVCSRVKSKNLQVGVNNSFNGGLKHYHLWVRGEGMTFEGLSSLYCLAHLLFCLVPVLFITPPTTIGSGWRGYRNSFDFLFWIVTKSLQKKILITFWDCAWDDVAFWLDKGHRITLRRIWEYFVIYQCTTKSKLSLSYLL